MMDDAEKWLRDDDRRSRAVRAGRLSDVLRLFPIDESGLITFGGIEAMTALTEARLAYLNGLYLCTILAALAVLERHFAGMFYAKGLEAAKRMSLDDVLKRAEKDSLITPEERSEFDKFRLLRNAYAHFREPAHELSGMHRAMREDIPFEDLLRTDAQTALELLARYFSRASYAALSLAGSSPASP